MVKNLLSFKDFYQFSYLDPSFSEVRDAINTPASPSATNKPVLAARIAATHSGIVTKNNTFYLPHKMKDGVSSFFKPFPKPVLTHHDELADPIGRIRDAEYIDLSSGVINRYKGLEVKDVRTNKTLATINEAFIKDFCSGQMPRAAQIDAIRSVLDRSILQDDDYEGLGYAEITAHITDSAAIEKFLDGRYLTGSVAADTDSATCSICKTDWMEEGKPCDHRPGVIYDKSKMFLIAGNFYYKEYSVVNKPADGHSFALELNYNGIKDSIIMDDGKSNQVYEISPTFFTLKDSEEGNDMLTDKEADKEETKVEDNEETEKDFLVRIFTTDEIKDGDKDKIYSLVASKLNKGEQLSDEQRIGLPKSVFYGAVPVPDEAHYQAVKALVDQVELPDKIKEKATAFLNKKAKAHDWKDAVKEEKEEVSDATTEDKKTEEKEDVKDSKTTNTLHNVLSLLEQDSYYSEPALSKKEKTSLVAIVQRLAADLGEEVLADALKEAKVNLPEDKELKEKVTSLQEENTALSDQVKEVKEVRDVLRQDYNDVYNDLVMMQDSLIKEKKEARELKVEHLSLLDSLQNKEVKENGRTEFFKLSDEALNTSLKEAIDKIDIKMIADKLGDGTSRKPEGHVEDPTGIQDDNTSEKFSSEKIKEELGKIRDTYTELLFKNAYMAEQFKVRELGRMISEGKLPQDFKFNK